MQLCKICSNRVSINEIDEECYICNGLSSHAYNLSNRIIDEIRDIEFNTFLIGIILPEEIKIRDKEFTDRFDVIPLKKYLNRGISNIITNIFKKRIDKHEPDLTILISKIILIE